MVGCASPANGAKTARGVVRATATTGLETPTPTTEELRLTALVRQAIGDQAQQIETSYDTQSASVTITIMIAGGVPNTSAKINAAHSLVKSLCFQTQRALWTSGVVFHEVTVTIIGLMQDEYASLIVDAYGAAVVEAQTAKRLDWESMNPESAWGRYDRVFLRQSFVIVA